MATGAYLSGLLVLFTISAYLSFNLFVRRGVTPVPDLLGMELESASMALGEKRLRLRRQPEKDRFSDQIPAGRVLEQRPGAGSLVKRGGVVEVVLSRGTQLVKVPDLRGQALQAAQVRVAASGLSLGRTAAIFASEARVGSVAEQHPSPGEEVLWGTPVDLFLAAESRDQTFVMPDLVYRDYLEVRDFFEARDFRLGSVKFEVYEGIEPGVVLRQFPLAGHPLSRDESISLVVAAVPEEAMGEGS
jgi:serine/threonine-protein kinase